LFKRLRRSERKEDALERLADIEAFLHGKNGEALNSLKEVGEDLITFFTLEVPSTLNRSLLSINAIENAFLNLLTLEESGVGEAILTKRTDGWPVDCTYPKRHSIEYLAATIWINSKLP